MSHRLRSVLSITPNQLAPKVIDPNHVIEQLKKKQTTQKKHYDWGSKPMSKLKPKDPVYIQAGDQWISATVVQKVNTPNSYIVKTTEGYNYWWNCRHLRRSFTQKGQTSDLEMSTDTMEELEGSEHSSGATINNSQSPQAITLSGRHVKALIRFQDYIRL